MALRLEHIAASRGTSEAAEAVIDALESVATPVFVAVMHRPLSQDENDDMVLDVAINGRAYMAKDGKLPGNNSFAAFFVERV